MTISYAHPAEGFEKGQLVCSGCSGLIEFFELSPLSVVTCPNCATQNLVPQKIGKYWLYHPLAVGGMGAVYKAYREGEPDVFYAVKILPRQERDNPTLIANLKAEIQVLQDIGNFPGIVYSTDSGFEDNEYYLATRFVDGESLDERIMRLGKLAETEVLFVALRILAAEHHIYSRGYLYRDLKPENILFSPEEGCFLCDFGICMHINEAGRVDTGDMIQGSPLYLPPERLLGEGEDVYSEIYSLGLVMYHMLTGRSFFEGDDIEKIARMHVEPPPLAYYNERLGQLAPDLARVIAKMIRREPKDRYQTFLEVERDLFLIQTNRLFG
ncbi:MAG: serine/threonine protein kinase [Lentisphaerae bacterium]|nr:MAG: serine/threonine protein kinase [Lentisphaerota bacterium]